eukprot:505333-Amphidinium_carterae.1
MARERPAYMLKLLKQHCAVLFSDVDNVWLRSPFRDLSAVADVTLPEDRCTDWELPFNRDWPLDKWDLSGSFIYVRPTHAAMEFMRQWS